MLAPFCDNDIALDIGAGPALLAPIRRTSPPSVFIVAFGGAVMTECESVNHQQSLRSTFYKFGCEKENIIINFHQFGRL